MTNTLSTPTILTAPAVPATPVTPTLPTQQLNKKQATTRQSKINAKKISLRNQLWKDITEADLWNRNTHDGYTTIPRTMPIILQIMDALADKGKPVSTTYLSLWFRVFDESFIEIKGCEELAFDSGFTGQRATTTWKQRMKKLEELGFINIKPGASGEFNYVLIYNPHKIIKNFYENELISETKYNALYSRAQDIGAKDLYEK